MRAIQGNYQFKGGKKTLWGVEVASQVTKLIPYCSHYHGMA